MITAQDLQEAIAECKGQRNPDANTCIKLAAFLTIQRELYGLPDDNVSLQTQRTNRYSFAAAPEDTKNTNQKGVEAIGDYGGSEFLQAIKGKDPETVFKIVDELMDTLMMVNKRVYDGVMRRIK